MVMRINGSMETMNHERNLSYSLTASLVLSNIGKWRLQHTIQLASGAQRIEHILHKR